MAPTVAADNPRDQTDRLDPWLDDGNVVLAAQGKYFRVHRSVLSAHSEVFKDMFDFSGPSDGEMELMEQCPVIHLHDKPNDLQMVLKALYDRSYPAIYYKNVPLSFVAASLHLGEKYAIERLFDEGKARLGSITQEPTIATASLISSSSGIGTLMLFPGVTGSDPYNFQIMNLLKEMDLQAPLPLAMYQCMVTCPLTTVIDGYEFNGIVYTLSRENLRSFIFMKEIFGNLRIQLAQGLRVGNHCSNQSRCICNIHRLWSDEETVSQPLGSWRQEWDRLFCNSCRPELNATRNALIQKAWNQVPGAFGFDSWAEVAKSGDFHPCSGLLTDRHPGAA